MLEQKLSWFYFNASSSQSSLPSSEILWLTFGYQVKAAWMFSLRQKKNAVIPDWLWFTFFRITSIKSANNNIVRNSEEKETSQFLMYSLHFRYYWKLVSMAEALVVKLEKKSSFSNAISNKRYCLQQSYSVEYNIILPHGKSK